MAHRRDERLKTAKRYEVHTSSLGVRIGASRLGTLTTAPDVAVLAGRALGIPGGPRTPVGVGTGICGAWAIVAVSGVIDAAEVDIADAMCTIFVVNLPAVLASRRSAICWD